MSLLVRDLVVRRLVLDVLERRAYGGCPVAWAELSECDPRRAGTVAFDLVMADLDALTAGPAASGLVPR